MKTLILILISVMCGLSQTQSANAGTAEDTERAFESEEAGVELRDIQGETQSAIDQAQQEMKSEREHRQNLIGLRSQRTDLVRTAKTRMVSAENRRVRAERAIARYDVEIKHLRKQIEGLSQEISQVEAAADDAEGLASEERAELSEYRQERREALKRLHHKKVGTKGSRHNKDLEAFHEALPNGEEF